MSITGPVDSHEFRSRVSPAGSNQQFHAGDFFDIRMKCLVSREISRQSWRAIRLCRDHQLLDSWREASVSLEYKPLGVPVLSQRNEVCHSKAEHELSIADCRADSSDGGGTQVAQDVWAQTFKYMADQKVLLEGILLKPAMVTPGADSSSRATPDQVAEYTLKLLNRRVPPAVPGAIPFSDQYLRSFHRQEVRGPVTTGVCKVNIYRVYIAYARVCPAACDIVTECSISFC